MTTVIPSAQASQESDSVCNISRIQDFDAVCDKTGDDTICLVFFWVYVVAIVILACLLLLLCAIKCKK